MILPALKKILLIIGTRPEAIKMAPVYLALQQAYEFFETKICLTGQHRELAEEVLDFFNIRADYQLGIMEESRGDLTLLTSLLLAKLSTVLEEFEPDCVLVQGDTSSAFSAALAAFYAGIKIGHVEAGLRTFDKHNPFPEEFNRVALSRMADFHFAPTALARHHLLHEKIPPENIIVCGNTGVDALLEAKKRRKDTSFPFEREGRKILLTTIHRRENQGTVFEGICSTLLKLSHRKGWLIVYPVHPNSNIYPIAHRLLANQPNLLLLDPLPYGDFIQLLLKSDLILTDSGGIQEEATVLGKPVLLVRKSTERSEAVGSGHVKMVGNEMEGIFWEGSKWMKKAEKGQLHVGATAVFGQGDASKQILNFLKERLGTQES